jgi:hypothetical protein
MMVNPPKSGDESFELYDQEYKAIKNGLKDRATALYEAFKKMEGVEVGEPQVSCSPLSLTCTRSDMMRDQCISSQPSIYQRNPSKPLRKLARSQTTSTVFDFSMLPASVLCLGQDSVKCQEHFISERLS